MLKSVKMVSKDGLIGFPPEIKEDFLATGGLDFKYSPSVSAEEIWEFLTVEAPRRFPQAFIDDPNVFIIRPSPYVEFLWTLKYRYCMLTAKDRTEKARKNGVPVVFVQGGQTQEPYYAANAIATRPYVNIILRGGMTDGLSYKQRTIQDKKLMEEGRKLVSPEACNGMIVAFYQIMSGISPTDLVAPYLCLRCSDIAYTTESHRSTERNTPTYLVDFPVDYRPGQDWKVEYVAEDLRRLVKSIVAVGGKDPSDEDMRQQIKQLNYARRLGRSCAETWMTARYVPSYGFDYRFLVALGNDLLGDPVSAIQILEQAKQEIEERAEKGIKGIEVAEDPVRLFVSGSCYTPNTYRIEASGGAVVAYDDQYNRLTIQAEETGDPYLSLAKAMLSYPYELPTEERARWIAGSARKARCDGVIFASNWGCQYQSAVSRMVGEIVKKEAHIPYLELEVDSLTQFEQLEQSENRTEAFIEMLSDLRK